MTMTGWSEAIRSIDKSAKRSHIEKTIKEYCLSRPDKVLGTYQVDHDKAWHYLVENNKSLKEKLIKENIHDRFQLEAYYEELKYKQFWGSWRSSYKKIRR